jgi:hypothetical protein
MPLLSFILSWILIYIGIFSIILGKTGIDKYDVMKESLVFDI